MSGSCLASSVVSGVWCQVCVWCLMSDVKLVSGGFWIAVRYEACLLSGLSSP